jgi:hypothetical protein
MTAYEVVGQRPVFTGESGAASGNRTPDLLITSETLQSASPPETVTSNAPSIADVSNYVSNAAREALMAELHALSEFERSGVAFYLMGRLGHMPEVRQALTEAIDLAHRTR